MRRYSAFFDKPQDLAKFFKATAGVQFTRDAYEFLGALWVDFTLDVLTEEQVRDKVARANGAFVPHDPRFA